MDEKEANRYVFAPMSWCKWNTLLTITIICVRAFQTNAEPMCQWSMASWIWMTLPMWLPAIAGIIAFIVLLVLWIRASI